MASNPLLESVVTGELRALLLGWFLWAPTALLVPAFGWPGSPLTPRLALGLGLSLCVAPSTAGLPEGWGGALAWALGIGVSVAVGAAGVLWAALMAGGVADRFGPGGGGSSEEGLWDPPGPLSFLFGLLSALFFLAGGGPARAGAALTRLARVPAAGELLQPILDACLASITLAVGVATPILLTVLLLEGIMVLLRRTALPLATEQLLGPLKTLAFLFLLAVALEPMLTALADALR